jgi:phosphoadenosine phosphosulfate reductase
MQHTLETSKFFRLERERQEEVLQEINLYLNGLKAVDRIEWAFKHISGKQALTSSFGIQSAVCLHMYSNQKPDIPVILIDTGYLFPETYRFVEDLKNKLNLNLKVYRSEMSPSWQEAIYGKLWESGLEGINKFNRINKVTPMAKALKELDLSIWHSGLRSEQSVTRKELKYLSVQGEQFKFLPILDWEMIDIENYLVKHKLDFHPLYYKGYTSVGDVHTSSPLKEGMKDEETRFLGLKRECGLHEEYFTKNS